MEIEIRNIDDVGVCPTSLIITASDDEQIAALTGGVSVVWCCHHTTLTVLDETGTEIAAGWVIAAGS